MDKIRPVERTEIIRPPESHQKLTSIAEETLKEAGTHGEIPTPLDTLMEVQGLGDVGDDQSVVDQFLSSLSSLSEQAQRTGKRALNKLRGVLDRRERKVWVKSDDNKPRQSKFPKTHEIGHDIISWHGVNPEYLDDDETLSPKAREQFEREANFIAGELLFQGDYFRDRALSAKESLHSALSLADAHETTYWSTLWRYIEVQDRPVGLAVYGRSNKTNEKGEPTFYFRRLNASERFSKECVEIEIPSFLDDHPWVEAATGNEEIVEGSCKLTVGSSKASFSWESWSNHYNLFVLIRREPKLAGIKSVI